MMLKQLLDQAVSLEPANTWPTYDGKILDRNEFVTSSEVASCLRQTFFFKQRQSGHYTNGFAERGHAIEAWLVGKLLNLQTSGFRFLYVGKDQRSFYDPELGLSGTPDGVMIIPDGTAYLLEFKSIDPRTNKNYLPKHKHKFQCQQNMYLVQKCTDIKLAGAILFYVDASDVFDVREYFFEYDEAKINECIIRAKEVWEAKGPDDLEPEGLYNGDCDRCPFTRECSAVIGMEKELAAAGAAAAPFSENLPDSTSEGELDDDESELISSFLYARRERKEFEDQEDGYKDDVNQLVIKHGGLLVHDGFVLSASEMPGRETLDKKRLETVIDLEEYTKVGKPFVVLNVKEQRQ